MQTNIDEVILLSCFIPTQYKSDIKTQVSEYQDFILMHSVREITAIFRKIPVEDAEGMSLEQQLNSLTSLTPHLLKHEAIIEKIMLHTPVFPVSLGILFYSLANLEQQMTKHYSLITTKLHKVTKQEEWAVKGFLESTKAIDKIFESVLAKQQTCLEQITVGTRYLKEQRLRNDVKHQLGSYLQAIFQSISYQLRLSAADFCERQVYSTTHNENNWPLVFNWAMLVPHEQTLVFSECFNQLKADYSVYGLDLRLTGPWPPYSFCQFR